MDELAAGIEERLLHLKEKLANGVSVYPDSIREEISELRFKYRLNAEKRTQLTSLKDFYKRQMLKGNPTMVSRKFGDMLRELQENVEETHKDDIG